MTASHDECLGQELDDLLNKLSSAHDELATILARQDELLATADAAGLQESANTQSVVVDRLQSLLRRREEWLQKASGTGQPISSISDWVQQVQSPESERWLVHLKTLQQSSDRIRRQSWRQWVVVQGAHRHQSELLHLIARNGRKTVGYGPSANSQSRGGAILDASA